MKKIFIFLLFFGLVCNLVAQKKDDPVVLKIGKKSFTLEEFEKSLNQMRVKYANLNPDMKKRLFDQFVKEKLFFTAAQDSGIKLTTEQNENIERIKTMYLINNYISKLLQEKPVTETEIKQEYERNPQQYQIPEKRKLRHILVSTEEQAKEILHQLKNGAKFEDLASQNNIDATKQRGGDLGWGQKGIYVKEFEDIAFSLKKDEISDIVKTNFGYHIIRVDEITPAQQRFLPEVLQEIRRKMELARITLFEEELKNKYKVWIDYSSVEKSETK